MRLLATRRRRSCFCACSLPVGKVAGKLCGAHGGSPAVRDLALFHVRSGKGARSLNRSSQAKGPALLLHGSWAFLPHTRMRSIPDSRKTAPSHAFDCCA